MHAAAVSLGYTTDHLTINGVQDINTFGFTVSHGGKVCYISNKTYFPDVPRWQLELMSDKILTSAALDALAYTQIKTVVVHPKLQTLSQSMNEALALSLPVITKPSHGSDGFGIQLSRTKKALREAVKTKHTQGKSFLVQAFIEKPEYRILVIDGEVAYIHRKKFPEITGDGTSSVADLLYGKKYRASDVVSYECKKHGYTLTSILPVGVPLKTHITKKSDPDFFISTNIPVKINTWSKNLARALGVRSMGIDAFIDGDLHDPSSITIIELNSKPSLHYIEKYYKNPEVLLHVATTILKNYFTTK